MPQDLTHVSDLVNRAAAIAREYRAATGRPLGITGEVGELRAAQVLGLQLAGVREAGFDAFEIVDGQTITYQIKTRCVVDGKGRSQRTGRLSLKHRWDKTLLVLLDADFEVMAIYEVDRDRIEELMGTSRSGAIARGALSTSWFKRVGILRWSREAA